MDEHSRFQSQCASLEKQLADISAELKETRVFLEEYKQALFKTEIEKLNFKQQVKSLTQRNTALE